MDALECNVPGYFFKLYFAVISKKQMICLFCAQIELKVYALNLLMIQGIFNGVKK